MNKFDATKCNADPRSVALSGEVYSALGLNPRLISPQNSTFL